MSDILAAQMRVRELTKDGIRHEDIPELRRLSVTLYSKCARKDFIDPLFNALQKKPRIHTDE